MSRRDIEKILSELGEIRRSLGDPNTGLTAFRQDQDAQHRKVLEHVTYSTTGVREENRELRRRQEKMLGDLGEVRAAVEGLRREIAQAWAHTLSIPHIPGTPPPVGRLPDPENGRPALEPGGDGVASEKRKDDASVPEENAPEVVDGSEPSKPQLHDDPSPEVTDSAAQQSIAPAVQTPADSSPELATTATSPAPVPDDDSPAAPETRAAQTPGTAAPAAPTDAKAATNEDARRREHLDSLLAAAAVSSARLICHKDTWAFLIEQTLRHAHFRLPDRITDTDDGKIDTHLSGRSLLAVLVTTHQILNQGADDDPAAWALASAINRRTRQAVTSATLPRPDDSDVTTIILDDRPLPAAD
ncbi:hypothetical protein [Streptomyces sp. NPDC001292]|uniref:hypothetical protein n=1 Tax=Streptomyces sp. NPDC001292 TaxID=3364558 RepID=UPI0036914A0C